MRTICLLSAVTAAASAFTPLSGSRTSLNPSLRRSGTVSLTLYDEYMKSRAAGGIGVAPPPPDPDDPESFDQPPAPAASADDKMALLKFYEQVAAEKSRASSIPAATDTDPDYKRVAWWAQGSQYTEDQRKDRRTVFMHDDWVRHRSSERFLRNMKTIGSSGINQALIKELAFVTSVATFVVVFNMLFVSYQDFGGVSHIGPLNMFDSTLKSLSLPALPFSIAMPALSLLLVFRTNTGYFRWNEARTLWGGLINNCRNVVRQTNTFFPDDAKHELLKRRMAAETQAFIRSLRNFLRGPSDDPTLRSELYELVDKGLMTLGQADDTMKASNRPMFCLSAMSATLRKADIDPMHSARIDSTISVLVDLTGANERIFKSPIPLVYTRLTSRFLTFFLILLPLALWNQLGESWNHWATIPAEFIISFFLFGIEEVGISIEEPFSILPLEAFCNGAITATHEEMLVAERNGVFEDGL